MWRRKVAEQIHANLTTAIKYEHFNPKEIHEQLMQTSKQMVELLDNFPPLITNNGVVTAREWLKTRGVVF